MIKLTGSVCCMNKVLVSVVRISRNHNSNSIGAQESTLNLLASTPHLYHSLLNTSILCAIVNRGNCVLSNILLRYIEFGSIKTTSFSYFLM